MKWKRGMGPLDMSRYHDILIEDPDGGFQPMDEPYYKAKKLAEGTWQVLSDGDYSYVIEGDDEAIVIDSGYGAGSIREFCQSLTGKPVYRLFNTHNHFDHTMNNYQFDVVYMSEKSYAGRCRPFGIFEGMDIPDDYPVIFLRDGDVINLKGRPIEVFAIEEHCMGSLQFLDRRERILFCGDELNGNFFDSRISVEHSFRNLRRWMSLRDEYDLLCAGNGIHDASYVDRYYEIAGEILAGTAGPGEEYYTPYEDPVRSVETKDGHEVRMRRSPNMEGLSVPLTEAGFGDHLKYNHGRGCFCFTRKLAPDGLFDRQIEKNGARFCFYLNRIWDRNDGNTNPVA